MLRFQKADLRKMINCHMLKDLSSIESFNHSFVKVNEKKNLINKTRTGNFHRLKLAVQ